MVCSNCGHEIDDNATECPYCNTPTENQDEQNELNTSSTNNTPSTNKTIDGFGIAGIVLGALGCPAGLLIALFGYLLGIPGLILSFVGRSKNKGSKVAIVGIIVSVAAILIALFNSILGVVLAVGSLL